MKEENVNPDSKKVNLDKGAKKKVDIQELNLEELEDIAGGGDPKDQTTRPYHMNTGHVPEVGG